MFRTSGSGKGFRNSAKFSWQAGYGAFSVSFSNLHSVRSSIGMQAEHPAKISFQDEFRHFLENHGLDYDEAFVWD